jgi:flagellar biosynthesis/type III secretory pathway chaperone
MAEKVPKYLISPEQMEWMKQHTALMRGLKVLAKQKPRNIEEAGFMRSLLNEVTKQKQLLLENLPKERVNELHDQPDPKDIDAYQIRY